MKPTAKLSKEFLTYQSHFKKGRSQLLALTRYMDRAWEIGWNDRAQFSEKLNMKKVEKV